MQAYLEDAYLNTSTMVDLDNTSTIDFAITSNPGSYASNRFKLIFKPLVMVPLPVQFIKVTAAKKDDAILVNWKVAQENGSNAYIIEKSIDGIHFNQIGSIIGIGKASYDFTDSHPVVGKQFYRIKNINDHEGMVISEVVFVENNVHIANPMVSPNPARANSVVSINVENMPLGRFNVFIFDNIGRKISDYEAVHSSNSTSISFSLPKKLACGMYNICVEGDGVRKCELIKIER